MNYYDKILMAIPFILLFPTGVLYTAGIDILIAIPVGTVLSIVLISHALFFNPPVDMELEPTPERTAQPNAVSD